MKLKKKTELRKMIKDSIGNTGSLDYVETYNDGTWVIMGCSTTSEHCIDRRSIAGMAVYHGYNETTGQAITANFQDIEEKL